MRGLYFKCDSGISGDMTVGALLDLGANKNKLETGLKSLNVEGFKIEIKTFLKNNKKVCDYNVIIKENNGELETDRNIFDVIKIIDNSSISEEAKKISKKIFQIKADIGSKVHKIPIENFYFHESGALDSIADIVGAAICLDDLKIDEVIVDRIIDGHGYMKVKDKILSVPVPATKLISKQYKLNLISTDVEGEMVTPTGASILAGVKTMDELPENYILEKIGHGNGKRNYLNGSMLEVWLISWEE